MYHVEEALDALQARADVHRETSFARVEWHPGTDCRGAPPHRNVQIGYNMRFHPGLQILKELIDSGKIGRVLWLSAEVGQYLPERRTHSPSVPISSPRKRLRPSISASISIWATWPA